MAVHYILLKMFSHTENNDSNNTFCMNKSAKETKFDTDPGLVFFRKKKLKKNVRLNNALL